MTEFTIAAGMSALTVVLLVVLTWTWIREYRTLRTPLILGVVLFCLLFLVENVVSLYFFFLSEQMFYVTDASIKRFVLIKHGLQLFAVAVFTYVSLR